MTDDGIQDALAVIQDAVMATLDAYHERLEREAVAAWMAGYTALDVVHPQGERPTQPAAEPGDWNGALTVNVAFVPNHDVDLVGYPDGYRVERFDLSDLTPAAASELRQNWADRRNQDGDASA